MKTITFCQSLPLDQIPFQDRQVKNFISEMKAHCSQQGIETITNTILQNLQNTFPDGKMPKVYDLETIIRVIITAENN